MINSIDLSVAIGFLLGALIAFIGLLTGFYLSVRYRYTNPYESTVLAQPDAISINSDSYAEPAEPEYVPFDDDGHDSAPIAHEDPGNDAENWEPA